ncbi:MAG: DUF1493 family protein [Prosthecobacter sp.]|uniref:DUF1493 family protein n=1 Tax=Prosthecobacter sp. TaxID=1965333 RepID=UPI002602AE21|nr:DUF1493 family protein [Prosthecobacter sp.]MCF7789043.1 DUF1493 family protein [Prosthecobacter sp.]
MQSLEESVIEFVADFMGFKAERIHLHTTLYGDLGIAGDDGLELIQTFGEKFQVDLTGFQSARHFGSEGLSVLAPLGLLWMVLSYPFRQKRIPEEESNLQAVRICDLIACARAGRWMGIAGR